MKKILARQLILWPKKNSSKEFDNEKKFLPLENSPPIPRPITFLTRIDKTQRDKTWRDMN